MSTHINNPEEFITKQNLISLGNRGADIAEATWKITGWSTLMRKEFGVGYKVMLFNSLGEQYGDREGRDEMERFFEDKGMDMVREHIDKLAALNAEMITRQTEEPEKDYTEELARMMMHFKVIRIIIENIYEKVSHEDQEYINAWRNTTGLFSSYDLFDKIHPQPEQKSEWSLIGYEDNITKVDTVLTYNTHSLQTENVQEFTGAIGFAGKITGKVRVALTKEERDQIQDGEIIVARMTTVDFLPAMDKAIAFITDEGGITCHAAIVAREMKKPCVIGARIATKVLKTGDMVEIDTTGVKGIVRKIS